MEVNVDLFAYRKNVDGTSRKKETAKTWLFDKTQCNTCNEVVVTGGSW
jgi:hypothetical protein